MVLVINNAVCEHKLIQKYSRVRREPQSSYGPPRPIYGVPKPRYGPPMKPLYGLPKPKYGPPKSRYITVPSPKYGPPKTAHGVQNPPYGPPKPVFGFTKPKYGLPPHISYGLPTKSSYGPPRKVNLPKTKYGPPKINYGPPKSSYRPPSPGYGPATSNFSPTSQLYGPQSQTGHDSFDSPISISDNVNLPSDFYNPGSSSPSFIPQTSHYSSSSNSYTAHSPNYGIPSSTKTSYSIPSTTYGIPSSTYGSPKAPPLTSVSSRKPISTSYVQVYKGNTPHVPTDAYGAPITGTNTYDSYTSSSNQKPVFHDITQPNYLGNSQNDEFKYPLSQETTPTRIKSQQSSHSDDVITSVSQHHSNKYQQPHRNGQKSTRDSTQSTKLSTSIRFPTATNDNTNEKHSGQDTQTASHNHYSPFRAPSQTYGFVPYDNENKKSTQNSISSSDTYSLTPSQGYYAGSTVVSQSIVKSDSAVLSPNYYDTEHSATVNTGYNKQSHDSQSSDSSLHQRRTEDQ